MTLYSLQFLRHVAASLVVFYHTVLFLAPSLEAHEDLVRHIAKLGASGVHIFFVISGFVMIWTQANAFGRAKPWAFAKRRIVRIYPIYWVLALLNIPLLVLLDRNLPATFQDWVGTLLLWPGDSSALIFVGWTLSYEVFFYVVFALFLAAQRSKTVTLITLTLFFFSLIVAGQLLRPIDPNAQALFVVTNVLLMEFVAGAWIAWFFQTKLTLPTWTAWGAILLGVLGFAASPLIGYDTVAPTVVIWGVPSILMVWGVVFLERRGKFTAFFARFTEAGNASYALYLVHPIVIPIGAFLLISDTVQFGLLTMLVILVISYVVIYWLSSLTHRLIEKPIQRSLRGFTHP